MDDWDQMRVVDLQAECRKRGLDHRGKKLDLVERLRSAVTADETRDASPESTKPASDDGVSKEDNMEQPQEVEDEMEQPAGADVDSRLSDDLEDRAASIGLSVQKTEEDRAVEESAMDDSADRGDTGAEHVEQEEECPSELTRDASVERYSSRKRQERSSSRNGRSRSRSPPSRRRRASPEWVVPEIQRFSPNTAFTYLNHCNAHLNLILAENCLSAYPMTEEGFCFAWGCCTGSHYIPTSEASLSVAFSVKLVEIMTPGHLSQDEEPFGLRVGWTMEENSCCYMLGEHASSYAYCSDGTKANNCEFEEYAESFSTGDVVFCLATFAEDAITLEFAKNGKIIEAAAFTLQREALQASTGKLFPQIAAKNCRFEVNFGQSEAELPRDDLVWTDKCENKQRGHVGSENKTDYEVVMMVGLPGSGKTYQTKKLLEENAEKRYWVLSADTVLQLMKVKGKERTRDSSSTFDVFKDRASRCVNRLLELAPSRPRNYIIDQANIYRDIQRRRLAPFKGFHRKVVVVVPEDSVYQQRLAKHDQTTSAIMEMKASMNIPGMDEVDEILFAELDADDARQLVERYNREANSARRRHDRSPHRFDRYSRRSPRPYRGDQRHSPLQRRRYGARRDWRNDSSSRLEPNRFQPRRPSRSPFDSGSYDYNRWYGVGASQKLGSFGSGGGFYGRQRRSISPSQRQSSTQRGSWNLGAGSSAVGASYRQQALQSSPSGFRARVMPGAHSPPPSEGGRLDFPPRPFSSQRSVDQAPGATVPRSHGSLAPVLKPGALAGKPPRAGDEWDSKRDYSGWQSGKQMGYGQRSSSNEQWSGDRNDWASIQPPSQQRSPWNARSQQSELRWSGGRNASGDQSWSATERLQWSGQRPGQKGDQWSAGRLGEEPSEWAARRQNDDPQWASDRSDQPSKWSSGRRVSDEWSGPHADNGQWASGRRSSAIAERSQWSDGRQASSQWSTGRASGQPSKWGAACPQWADSGPHVEDQSQWAGGQPSSDQQGQWPRPYGASRQPLRPGASNQWRPKYEQTSTMWQAKAPAAAAYQPQQQMVRPAAYSQDAYGQRPYNARMYAPQTAPTVPVAKYQSETGAAGGPASAAYQQQGWQQSGKPMVAPSQTAAQPGYAPDYSYGAVRPQQPGQVRAATYAQQYNRPPATPTAWSAARPAQPSYGQSAVAQYQVPQRPTVGQQATIQQYSQPTAATWAAAKPAAAAATTPAQYATTAAQQSATTDAKPYLTAGYNYSALYAVQQAYGQQQQTPQTTGYQLAASSQPSLAASSAASTSTTGVTTTAAASTSASATTSSTQQQQQPQMIDEATAYAGYLSVGYDQATAKAMATAYVQQQQQYYQWQQQWAAAAAAAAATQPQSSTSASTSQQSQHKT